MKANGRTAQMLVCFAVVLAIGATVFVAGCQMPGKLVSSEPGKACPMCKTEVRTMAVKGMTYTQCVCPGCKKVSTIDPGAPASLADYVDPASQTVLVCEHCKAIVGKCPACRMK